MGSNVHNNPVADSLEAHRTQRALKFLAGIQRKADSVAYKWRPKLVLMISTTQYVNTTLFLTDLVRIYCMFLQLFDASKVSVAPSALQTQKWIFAHCCRGRISKFSLPCNNVPNS